MILTVVLCSSAGIPSLASTALQTGEYTGPAGSVTGRVTTPANVGVGSAYVAIVSANDTSIELYSTTSDAYGNYQFTGISNTLRDNGSMENAYEIHAFSWLGDGYSNSFGVSPNNTTATSVVIVTKPQNISLTASKYQITADGTDQAILTAYVTDGLGNPVADGFSIRFSVQNQSNDPVRLGMFSSLLPPETNETIVQTVEGNASALFGWTLNPEANYTITASWADNGSIYGSVTVYSIPLTQHGTGIITGRVVYGNTTMGLGNARVTLCSPPDFEQELYSTYTDADGYFQMSGINDTVNYRGYASLSYMLHAYDDRFGTGYSGCFGVWPNMVKNVNISIYPPPANIVVVPGQDSVVADGNDNTTITAYAYDFLGNPVSSQSVRFQVLNTSDGMGKITDEYESFFAYDLTPTIMNGSVSMKFGWMTTPGATNTIVVSSLDNASVNGSVYITGMPTHPDTTGSVTGRVTTPTNAGVGGAYVVIVSIYDPSVEFYNTTSDAYGNYQFTGVNNTLMADGRLDYAYMIHASHAYYGEGYTDSFGVSPNNATNMDVVLYTEPQNVSVTASRGWVTANGTDYTIVTAYVTDANGNPISDGFAIGFELLNQSGDQAQLGNASTGVPAGSNITVARTVGGNASVAFGWTRNPYTNYTITAFYHDNRSISGSTEIYSVFPKDDPGMVTGRVTTATGNDVGNAYVAIVSAYNTSIVLYNTTSSTYGYYQFVSVNNTLRTDGTLDEAAYKIYVRSPYGEGCSSAFGVKPVEETVADVIISAIPQTITVTASKHEIVANGTDYTVVTANVTDAWGNPVADGYTVRFQVNNASGDMAQLGDAATGLPGGTNTTAVQTRDGYAGVFFGWTTTPDVNYTITASWAENGSIARSAIVYSAVRHGTGSVVGRVTTATNATQGIGGAYVAIVSAYDPRVELYNTTSDAFGNYQFTGVNDTLRPDGTPDAAYMVHAYSPQYGDGFSNAFGVEPDRTTAIAVVIFTKPVKIVVGAEMYGVVANGQDHTTISAYVTDAMGSPVADGYMIRFHMGTNSTGMGQFAGVDSSVPAGTADMIVPTRNGSAKIEFGWMTKVKKSNTITAYWVDDVSVTGMTTIKSVLR